MVLSILLTFSESWNNQFDKEKIALQGHSYLLLTAYVLNGTSALLHPTELIWM